MKSKLTFILLLLVILFMAIPLTANADMGPKPSIVISFEGLENEKYYVTLLSETSTTGPHRVYDGESNPKQFFYGEDEDKRIWQKFVSYEDEDGFYFLQFFVECTKTSYFSWGYYPPSKFNLTLLSGI